MKSLMFRRFEKSVPLLRTVTGRHTPDHAGARAGTAAAAALAGIGCIHLAWGLGVTYPAKDSAALARTVVGGDTFPSPSACVAVAGLLGAAAALVSARAKPDAQPGRHVPIALAGMGSYTVGAVLALRGAVGVALSAVGAPATTPQFRLLNLIVYSPLCLALAAAIVRMER
jgi:hypothetical protein